VTCALRHTFSIIGFSLAVFLSARHALAQDPSGPSRGHLVFSEDFEKDDALKTWPGAAQLGDGRESKRSLLIRNAPQSATGSAMCSRALPVQQIRGCSILIAAQVRAENISAKPDSWNGVKLMLAIDSPGGKFWPQASIGTGSFDWRKFTFAVRIPKDATAATLCLGLEKVSGSNGTSRIYKPCCET